MADSKISALPASTVPLAGTEVLPIVQSSTTKQVSVANLTAGRSFDALGMTLTSTDAGATEGPLLDLYRDSATPAASDTLAEIVFNGKDSAGNKQKYACIHGSILSPTSGSEQGQIHFETQTAGASTEKMIIGTTNLVINEIGAVFNVRIEGDTDANLFYTDATNDKVGLGTASPAEKLDVVGKIKLSDNLVIGTSGKGIDFSITSHPAGMTSELLADYEEGTWTPTITRSTTDPTVTYGYQNGSYVKVGKLVYVTCGVSWATNTGGSGSFQISGLPYTNINSSPNYSQTLSIDFSGITFAVGATQLGGYVNINTTNVILWSGGSAISSGDVTLAGSGYVYMTACYVAST